MANASILNAFERMKQHIVAALANKSDVGHTHTAAEVGADSSGTASTAVATHNTSTSAHSDIRSLVSEAKTAAANAQTTADGKAPANHSHSEYVTLSGYQTMTSPKVIRGLDSDDGSSQPALLKVISTNKSGGGWTGRMMAGAEDLTFLMGTYQGLAGIGAHSWTSAASGTGAAWAPMYFNPDGTAPVYIGANGTGWTADKGTLKVQGSLTSGAGAVDVFGSLRVNGANVMTQVFHAGTTAPSDTRLLWIDTGNSNIIKFYNGSAWTNTSAVWGT